MIILINIIILNKLELIYIDDDKPLYEIYPIFNRCSTTSEIVKDDIVLDISKSFKFYNIKNDDTLYVYNVMHK